MLDLLLSIFGQDNSLGSATLGRARIIYARWAVTCFLLWILLLLVGLGFNCMGWKGVNIFFLLAFDITLLIIGLRPDILASVLGLGVGAGIFKAATSGEEAQTLNEQLPGEMQDALEVYKNFLLKLAFWATVGFFFLGTVSMKESPKMFFVIAAALTILYFASVILKVPAKLFYKISKWYAWVILFAALLLLVPSWLWIRVIGYDVSLIWEGTKTEAALSDLEKIIRDKEDEERADKVKAIIDKVERGENLSKADAVFLQSEKSNRERESIPGKVFTLWGGTNIFPALSAKFTPDFFDGMTGEKLIGTVGEGEYKVEISGKYTKVWSNGRSSMIEAAVGIKHPNVSKEDLPLYLHRGYKGSNYSYGMVFIRIKDRLYVNGDKVFVSSPADVFAEANVQRTKKNKNYENSGVAAIKLWKLKEVYN